MFPKLPRGVMSNNWLKMSHEPSAHSFLILSRVKDPFLKLQKVYNDTSPLPLYYVFVVSCNQSRMACLKSSSMIFTLQKSKMQKYGINTS